MELLNYKDNCRLCLKTHTDLMKNIFTHRIEGCPDTLVQNIYSLLRIKLSHHKDYPQFICRKCLTELENILLFREDLQRNQDFLLGLFTAAYPDYVEKKNLQNLSYSIKSGVDSKSVAVNTESIFDIKNLGVSEYVKVPVTFLKQFSPHIHLQQAKFEIPVKKSPEIKEEHEQDDFVNAEGELSVNFCKYCNKVFRSQGLLDTHCKKYHNLSGQPRKSLRKRTLKDTQKPLVKKVKIDENKNVSFPILSGGGSSISTPKIHFHGPVQNVKAAKDNTSTDNNNYGDSVFPANQASFLQNFNLIAKQEAVLIKTELESRRSLLKRQNLKKQKILSEKLKRAARKAKSKSNRSKPVGKPLSLHPKPCKSKSKEQNILSRSIEFLKRYGWRRLVSSSRRGTVISTDRRLNLDKKENLTNKSVNKRTEFPKSSTKSSEVKENIKVESDKIVFKTVLKDKGCESEHRLGDSDEAQKLKLSSVKLKRHNSSKSCSDPGIRNIKTKCNYLNNSSSTQNPNNLTYNLTSVEEMNNPEDLPTTSINSIKHISETEKGVKEGTDIAKTSSDIKSEIQNYNDQKEQTEVLQTIPPKSFYDKNKNNIPVNEPQRGTHMINDSVSRNTVNKKRLRSSTLNEIKTYNNPYARKTNQKHLISSKHSTNSNGTKLAHSSVTEGKCNLDNYSETKSLSNPQNPQSKTNENGLKLKLFRSSSIDSLSNCSSNLEDDVWTCRKTANKLAGENINSSEREKELRIPLDRHESPKERNRFNDLTVKCNLKDDSTFPEIKPNISHLDALINKDINQLPKIRNNSRNCEEVISLKRKSLSLPCDSEKDNSLPTEKMGSSLPNQRIRCKLLSSLVHEPSKKIESTNISTSTIPTGSKSATDLNKGTLTNENSQCKKRGRPKKLSSFDSTSSSSTDSKLQASSSDIPSNMNNIILEDKSSLLLNKTQNAIDRLGLNIKKEGLSTFQDLNDRYEIDENIGLRIKLRRTMSCESLNMLKYDTQEFDENIHPKTEVLDYGMHLDNVPDNKIFSTDLDNKISNALLKEDGPIPEKIFNVNLEDDEIQMLVLVSDNEAVDFDNDDLTKYVKPKRNRFELNDGRFWSSENDGAREDNVFKAFTSHQQPNVNTHTNLLPKNTCSSISNVAIVGSEETIKQRERASPIKFLSSYTFNKSKSTVDLKNNTSHRNLYRAKDSFELNDGSSWSSENDVSEYNAFKADTSHQKESVNRHTNFSPQIACSTISNVAMGSEATIRRRGRPSSVKSSLSSYTSKKSKITVDLRNDTSHRNLCRNKNSFELKNSSSWSSENDVSEDNALKAVTSHQKESVSTHTNVLPKNTCSRISNDAMVIEETSKRRGRASPIKSSLSSYTSNKSNSTIDLRSNTSHSDLCLNKNSLESNDDRSSEIALKAVTSHHKVPVNTHTNVFSKNTCSRILNDAMGSEEKSIRRVRARPIKFSPSTYTSKRSKSTVDLKNNTSNRTQESCPKNRSKSLVNLLNRNESFGDVREKSQFSKANDGQSTLTQRKKVEKKCELGNSDRKSTSLKKGCGASEQNSTAGLITTDKPNDKRTAAKRTVNVNKLNTNVKKEKIPINKKV